MKILILCVFVVLQMAGGCLHSSPREEQSGVIDFAKKEIASRNISFKGRPSYFVSRHGGVWFVEVEEEESTVAGRTYWLLFDEMGHLQSFASVCPVSLENLGKKLAPDGDFARDLSRLDEWAGVSLTNINVSGLSLATNVQSIAEVLKEKGIGDEAASHISVLRQVHAHGHFRHLVIENLLQWISKRDSGAWVEYLFGPPNASGVTGNGLGWLYGFEGDRLVVYMDQNERVLGVEWYPRRYSDPMRVRDTPTVDDH